MAYKLEISKRKGRVIGRAPRKKHTVYTLAGSSLRRDKLEPRQKPPASKPDRPTIPQPEIPGVDAPERYLVHTCGKVISKRSREKVCSCAEIISFDELQESAGDYVLITFNKGCGPRGIGVVALIRQDVTDQHYWHWILSLQGLYMARGKEGLVYAGSTANDSTLDHVVHAHGASGLLGNSEADEWGPISSRKAKAEGFLRSGDMLSAGKGSDAFEETDSELGMEPGNPANLRGVGVTGASVLEDVMQEEIDSTLDTSGLSHKEFNKLLEHDREDKRDATEQEIERDAYKEEETNEDKD